MPKTKDEIINKLIHTSAKEVDYWLLDSNQNARVDEYGKTVYDKMVKRYTELRSHLLEAIFDLTEIVRGENDALDSGILKKTKHHANHV